MKYFLLTFLALFFIVFLLYPLGDLIEGAFFYKGHVSVGIFYILLKSQLFYTSLANSVIIGVSATLATIAIAIPLALLFTRFRFPGAGILQMMLLIPLILPPFVGAIGLKHIFARFGMVNLLLAQLGIIPINRPIDWFGGGGLSAVILIEVLHLFPILYMSAAASLSNLDQSLLDAAANLGASPWRRLRTITLPMAMPGFFAGASVTFISAITDLGTPLIFNLNAAVPVQIFVASTNPVTEQAGYALVVLTMMMVLFFFLLIRRFGESPSGASRPGMTAVQGELTGLPGFLAAAAVSLLVFMAVLPHLGVILTSFASRWFFTILPSRYTLDYYGEVFSSPTTRQCVFNSVFYSTPICWCGKSLSGKRCWIPWRCCLWRCLAWS
jgi:iron(III) transport system permease protein